MPGVSDIAVSALQTDQARLRIIAQNLANTSTPGYRAEVAAPHQLLRFDALMDAGPDTDNLPQARVLRSDRAGALQQTNRQLDLAIEGNGFFELVDGGQTLYSRRGDFQLGPDGTLLGGRGLPVGGTAGSIRLPDANVQIQPDGRIEKDGVAVAQLAVAHFHPDAQLMYLGDGVYKAAESPLARSDEASRIRQGYIEAANVRPMDEMARMMEISRHFGASAQALKAYDQMLESALSGLGSY